MLLSPAGWVRADRAVSAKMTTGPVRVGGACVCALFLLAELCRVRTPPRPTPGGGSLGGGHEDWGAEGHRRFDAARGVRSHGSDHACRILCLPPLGGAARRRAS